MTERVGDSQHAVERPIVTRAKEPDEIRLARPGVIDTRRSDRLPDPTRGVADGQHAVPPPAAERGEVRLM